MLYELYILNSLDCILTYTFLILSRLIMITWGPQSLDLPLSRSVGMRLHLPSYLGR